MSLQDHRQRFQNIAKVADIKMKTAQILTREGTKCVAIPIATSSLPFNLAPVKAKNSPESVTYIREISQCLGWNQYLVF